MTRTLGMMLTCGLFLVRAHAPAGEKAQPFEHSADEIKISKMTNEERKKEDIAPLVLNPALSKVARAHSENMVKQMKLDHNLDDKTPFDRLRAAGYKYMSAGENIAYGEENPSLELIMKSWMESKGHRANIMQPNYTQIGVGIARDKNGVTYFTQVFGKPFKK